MSTWGKIIVTNAGDALRSKLMAGNTLAIVEAVAGAGYVDPSLLQEQIAVTEPMQTLNLYSVSDPEEGKCAVLCTLTNDGVTTGYVANQIGLYAMDPDAGKILFCILQSVDGDGEKIPAAAEMDSYSADWTLTFKYGQADSVDVTVDPANTVTYKGLELYFDMVAATDEEIDAAMGVTWLKAEEEKF